MDSSGEGGDEGAGPAPGSPAQGSSAPAARAGAGGASGSSGRLPAKRVMKTPYQLEVLERTYTGSPTVSEHSDFFLGFVTACFRRFFVSNHSIMHVLRNLVLFVMVQRTRTRTRRRGWSCL